MNYDSSYLFHQPLRHHLSDYSTTCGCGFAFGKIWKMDRHCRSAILSNKRRLFAWTVSVRVRTKFICYDLHSSEESALTRIINNSATAGIKSCQLRLCAWFVLTQTQAAWKQINDSTLAVIKSPTNYWQLLWSVRPVSESIRASHSLNPTCWIIESTPARVAPGPELFPASRREYFLMFHNNDFAIHL